MKMKMQLGLSTYLKRYQQEGISGLEELHYAGQPSQLDNYSDRIKEDFKDDPPSTLSEASDRIAVLTGVKRSLPQIRLFLIRLGIKRLKTGSLPGGHKGTSAQKRKDQKEFLSAELHPRLKKAAQGQGVLLFSDAAHFVHGAFMSFVWCFCRIFIGTPPGRKRYNVLGAIDAVSMEFTSVENQDYINAKSVCSLLKKLYLKYCDRPYYFGFR